MPSASRREVFESQTTIAGGGKPSGNRSKSRLRQSSVTASPARPKSTVNWSSSPEATPTKAFSERWRTRARVIRASSSRSAGASGTTPALKRNRASAAWRLAELERPAPSGTSPAIAASTPETNAPRASRIAHDTPRTYRPQVPGSPGSIGSASRSKRASSPKFTDWNGRRPTGRRPTGDRRETVDRHGQHEAAVVVGVIAQQFDPPGRAAQDRRTSAEGFRKGLDRLLFDRDG